MVLNFWRTHAAYDCHRHRGDGGEADFLPLRSGHRGLNGCVAPFVGDEDEDPLRGKSGHESGGRSGESSTTAAPAGSLLALARERGYSALGEMFNGTQLAALAAGLGGYRAAVWHSSSSSSSSSSSHHWGRCGGVGDEGWADVRYAWTTTVAL